MKLIKCEKCEYQIPTVMNVNCRVIRCDRKDTKYSTDIICTLGIYCPTCGKETLFSVQRYFTKDLLDISKLPTEYLRDIVLCENGIV